jgi:soluble lytic murein transglycosylase-like protein
VLSSPRASVLRAAPAAAFLLAACASAPEPRPEGGRRGDERIEAVLPIVRTAAARNRVQVELVLGVIAVESSFKIDERSSAGARGLMQLMPRTAASLAFRLGREGHGIDQIDQPEFNIEAGTAYLALLLERFGKDERLALAAYNSGPSRVEKWQRAGTPLPEHSERYIAAVLAARDHFVENGPYELPPGRGRAPGPEGRALDQKGLRDLVRKQSERYGDRPDDPIPKGSGVPDEGYLSD